MVNRNETLLIDANQLSSFFVLSQTFFSDKGKYSASAIGKLLSIIGLEFFEAALSFSVLKNDGWFAKCTGTQDNAVTRLLSSVAIMPMISSVKKYMYHSLTTQDMQPNAFNNIEHDWEVVYGNKTEISEKSKELLSKANIHIEAGVQQAANTFEGVMGSLSKLLGAVAAALSGNKVLLFSTISYVTALSYMQYMIVPKLKENFEKAKKLNLEITNQVFVQKDFEKAKAKIKDLQQKLSVIEESVGIEKAAMQFISTFDEWGVTKMVFANVAGNNGYIDGDINTIGQEFSLGTFINRWFGNNYFRFMDVKFRESQIREIINNITSDYYANEERVKSLEGFCAVPHYHDNLNELVEQEAQLGYDE